MSMTGPFQPRNSRSLIYVFLLSMFVTFVVSWIIAFMQHKTITSIDREVSTLLNSSWDEWEGRLSKVDSDRRFNIKGRVLQNPLFALEHSQFLVTTTYVFQRRESNHNRPSFLGPSISYRPDNVFIEFGIPFRAMSIQVVGESHGWPMQWRTVGLCHIFNSGDVKAPLIPLSIQWSGLIANILIVALVILFVMWGRKRIRILLNKCANCNYSLVRTISGRCPECGLDDCETRN